MKIESQRPIDAFVKPSQHILQREYVIIGKRRVSSVTAWTVIAFFVGITIATSFLVSRSGTLEESFAAETNVIVIATQGSGVGDIPAVSISGSELCKISDFHRRKVLDEVKQAHKRVINTCNDSDKFNAAEKIVKKQLGVANYYLAKNNLYQTMLATLNAVSGLRDMRRWSVQASFDTVALDDWRAEAAAIRNTCGVGLPGSNAQDNVHLKEAFNCAKSLIPRFVAAERGYFDLITKIDNRINFGGIPGFNTSLSDWFDATYTDPNSFFASRSITNFDEYLAAINGLSLAQADDSWRKFLIQDVLAVGGGNPSELGGLSGANPGSMLYNVPSAAYNIIKYGKKFVNWIIDLGQFGSGIKYDKQNIIDAANNILKRIVPKPSFTLVPMRYDEITHIATIASSNDDAFEEFIKMSKWGRLVTTFELDGDNTLSEESMERVERQIELQFIEKCHIENPTYSIEECIIFAWNLRCKFSEAISGYQGPVCTEIIPPACKALDSGGVVGDSCHPLISVEL